MTKTTARSIPSISPLTEETIGCYPIATEEEVVATVAKAQTAFAAWSLLSPQQRCRRLRTLRTLLVLGAEQLAQIVHYEIGKPIQEVYGAEILPTLRALIWLEQRLPKLLHPRRQFSHMLLPQPYGIIGIIGTWNYPIWLNIAPILWALAAGNTVVWKPSELALASACALQRYFEQANLPVFLVLGDGATGQILCRSPLQKLVFTGSATTGRAILATLAEHLIPSVMELSGNDAAIVLADADLKKAARSLVWARCCNAGQSCMAPQRIFVHQQVYPDFLKLCKQQMEHLQPEQEMSPLRTAELRRRVHVLVEEACCHGARLVVGGYCLQRPGYFYAPTLVADCTDTMRLMQEDLFGPVLAVSPIQNDQEAIRRANNTPYALGASVWTKQRQLGLLLAEQLKAGVIAINGEELLVAANAAIPFGGTGFSGFGKQHGTEGFDEFVTWKVVCTASSFLPKYHQYPYHAASVPILQALTWFYGTNTLSAKFRALRSLLQAISRWKQRH